VYRLNLDPVAEEQINAVPEGALRPLAELFTLLETAPWSGQPFNPANPRGNMLTHAFGERGSPPTSFLKNSARYTCSALNGRDRPSVTSSGR
jgi:hypothetical protein